MDKSQYLNFTIQLFLEQSEFRLEILVVNSLQQARALVDGIRGCQSDARPYGVSHGLGANCCQKIVHSRDSVVSKIFTRKFNDRGRQI